MINILCFDALSLTEEDFSKLYEEATEERQRMSDKYSKLDDKLKCICADALLRYAIKKELSIEKMPSISKNEHGKPFFEDLKDFHFNISHSGKWVVLAYGDNNAGVDIEKMKESEWNVKLAKRYFSENEQEYVFSEGIFHHERFFEIWTGKESYLKYLGTGINRALDSFSVLPYVGECLFGEIFEKDYYLSLFTHDKEHNLTTLTKKTILTF